MPRYFASRTIHGALRDLPFDQADDLVMLARTDAQRGRDYRGGNAFDYRSCRTCGASGSAQAALRFE